VDLGEDVSGRNAVAALADADDADGVVDLVVLRPAAGTELERRGPDPNRAERCDVPVA
jgi:hypothetical protein